MACALTKGFTLDCKSSNGGIEAVYFLEFANKGTVTAASGVVSAWTPASSKKFWKYELRKKTSQLTQNFQVNNENGTVYYEQALTIKLDKQEATKRNEILLLAQNDLLVIVKDNNGKYWLMGYTRGAHISGGSGQTGTAFGDMSGYEINFTGEEPELAYEVDSSLIASIVN